MPWRLHTSDPTPPKELRAALGKVRDTYLRADERLRILEAVETDEAAVAVTKKHMDRAIDAAVALAKDAGSRVHVSLHGDLSAEGVIDRTSVSIDVLLDQNSAPAAAEK